MSQVDAGSKPKSFRTDINGLRAIAVLAVVFYHFGIPGLSGGFAGVDVFFVISGFLMAGIVVKGIERSKFSVWDFYLARAKRILPALMVMTAVVLASGWFLLMPSEYREQARHVRDSLLFSSNLTYLHGAGYFDSASHSKWLLHTWSLSVEWQFYLLYPLGVLFLARLTPSRKALACWHALALIVSFVACQMYLADSPDKAFYTLQARAWELLIGGLVFLLAPNGTSSSHLRSTLVLCGLSAITVGFFLVTVSSPWPGFLALLPTLGTALVLLAGTQNSLLLGSRPAQWFGTRSYSIYLWHWPLVVLLATFDYLENPYWVFGAICLSFLLGHISFVLIEKPSSRRLTGMAPRYAFASLVGILILITVPAQVIRKTGVPQRLPNQIVKVDQERDNKNPRRKECLSAEADCILGGKQVEAILLGDSHADAVATALVASLPDKNQGIAFRGEKGCLFVIGSKRIFDEEKDECIVLKDRVLPQLDQLYPGKPIIVINRTTVYALGERGKSGQVYTGTPTVFFSEKHNRPDAQFLNEFKQRYLETACLLAKDHPLYLMRPIPEMPTDVPLATGRALMKGDQLVVSQSLDDYRERHAFVWEIQDEAALKCGAKILDPLPYLCDSQQCYGSKNNMPLYYDDDHLSESGNRLLLPMFAPIFTRDDQAQDGAKVELHTIE